MQTISHSQAHASGDLASAEANTGRIARINEARALKASDTGLFAGALQAIRTVDMTPDRVKRLIDTLNTSLESNPQFQVGHGNYGVRCAVLQCLCALEDES